MWRGLCSVCSNFLSYSSSIADKRVALVRIAICLGRSPGFRRRDVERIVDAFLASQTSQLYKTHCFS
jgi:hypothetical protein